MQILLLLPPLQPEQADISANVRELYRAAVAAAAGVDLPQVHFVLWGVSALAGSKL